MHATAGEARMRCGWRRKRWWWCWWWWWLVSQADGHQTKGAVSVGGARGREARESTGKGSIEGRDVTMEGE